MIDAAQDPHGDAHVKALGSSVRRLAKVVQALGDDDLSGRSYASEWSIADVLSHLGSGAVITQRRLEDTLGGQATPDDHAPGVWDEWNAKTPAAQRRDALVADADLLAALEGVPTEERDRVSFAMGPMTLTFADFVGMRLNEHAFHTWDIEVAADPSATVPAEAAALMIDNLELVARFTARPTGDTRAIGVRTTNPERSFTVDLTPDAAALQRDESKSEADLELPAEAFARLVYGRLDSDHTPAGQLDETLDQLRQVFPGP